MLALPLKVFSHFPAKRERKYLSVFRALFLAACLEHFVIFFSFFWHPYFQPSICQLCAEKLNAEYLSLGLIILLSKGFLHTEIFQIKALKNKAVTL